jgi:hypothetical protein
LLGPLEFVDRWENSIDPLSNEFSAQAAEIMCGFIRLMWPFRCKKKRFSLFSGTDTPCLRPSPGVLHDPVAGAYNSRVGCFGVLTS